jgi:glycosyltransferase involved in cell wall biosynthesis
MRQKNSIWIISAFTRFDQNSNHAGRFLFIANSVEKAGYKVTFFTSKFDHLLKKNKVAPKTENIKFVFIYEPGYAKNVSLKRIISHLIFSAGLFLHILFTILLKEHPKSIYCALPHNLAAVLIGILAKIFRIKFITDIHDTWPENILSVYKLKTWQKPFYYAWKSAADLAIYLSDRIFAESNRYAERANEVRIRYRKSPAKAVYLGGDSEYYDTVAGTVQLPSLIEKGFPKFVYAGSLGLNYDLEMVIKTFNRFNRCFPKSWLVLLGGGECEADLRRYAESLHSNIWFSGYIDHASLVQILRQMDFGINSFTAGGNVAYSYKFNDYMLAGIPVINSLGGEIKDLIRRYGIGYNYTAGSAKELYDALELACLNKNYKKLSKNVRRFSSSCLNWHETYQPILKELLSGCH